MIRTQTKEQWALLTLKPTLKKRMYCKRNCGSLAKKYILVQTVKFSPTKRFDKCLILWFPQIFSAHFDGTQSDLLQQAFVVILSVLIFQKYHWPQEGKRVGSASMLAVLSLQKSDSRGGQAENFVMEHCWWTTP